MNSTDRSGTDQTSGHLEQLVEAQATILDLVGSNAPIEVVLGELCNLFQDQIEGSVASILLANEDGTALLTGIAPDLDKRYCEAIDPLAIADGVRSCGTAAFRREPVITTDIATDPIWDDARADALAAGLRACWSVPIVESDDQILGTFAAYWPEVTAPGPRDIWVQQQFARLARVAIERQRFQDHIGQMLADERRHLAEDLHDDPIQAITAVGLGLQRLARTAAPEQHQLLSELQLAVSGAVDRMRVMLFDLHPPTLDDEGLGSAIELYLYERFDPAGLRWDLHDKLNDTQLTPATTSLAYRLAREALSNVLVHAEATKAEITLETDGDSLSITIVDDGKGFDTATVASPRAGHLGMRNCTFLARRASGTWDVTSRPGRGTTVHFRLPPGLL